MITNREIAGKWRARARPSAIVRRLTTRVIAAENRERPRGAAGGEDQTVKRQVSAIRKLHSPRIGFDARGCAGEDQIDIVFGPNGSFLQFDVVRAFGAEKDFLREGGPLIRKLRLIADKGDRACKAGPPQMLGHPATAMTGANDDDPFVGVSFHRGSSLVSYAEYNLI
jgi:hypothetical protein